jgi:signal transduction histidine kinase
MLSYIRSAGSIVRAVRLSCRTRLLLACAGMLLIAWPEALTAQTAQKEVLVLYSTRRDAQLSIIGDRDLPRILEQGIPEGLDFYSEYLDLARSRDPEYLHGFRDFLRVKYSGIVFDVVITMQETALDFVNEYRADLFPETPIVFLSTSTAIPKVPNGTGILAPPLFDGTVDLAAALQPDLREVFVVTGAGSIDRDYETAVRAALRRFESRLHVTFLSALTMPEIQAKVASLPDRSAVFFVMVYRDGAGTNFHPLESLDEVARVANAPVYCWVDSGMDHGIVGGYLKDQQLQTAAIGKLALRVLHGERAEDIPVETPAIHVNEVDWRQLRRWGISEALVPASTQIKFREPGLWERARWYILGTLAIVVAQTVLIAALLVQRAHRQEAEERVRNSQTALQRSFDRIRDLGARLIGAQDEERARIARELHDDVSQQMALLEIDIELLRGATDGPSESVTAEVLARARSIARSVHDLSHRLHPAKLRLIGLASALEGLRREMSQGDITITFAHDAGPPLPADVTLCLFRVAQEALQNAVKYSNGRVVSMHLAHSPDAVTLTIRDDGNGFDAEAALGEGLGLISMQERAEAVGGRLEIQSRPDTGTQVTLRVPFSQKKDSERLAV